jgi:amino-acid N-acetyltransferase
MNIKIMPAQAEHLPALSGLLSALHLPVSDLPEGLGGFFLAFDGQGQLVGSAGVERLGGIGLLRSVAVLPEQRKLGLGQQLQESALEAARGQGISAVFLITDSAAAYFEKHGFRRIARAEAPVALAQTAQFSGLCPSSAVVMRRDL